MLLVKRNVEDIDLIKKAARSGLLDIAEEIKAGEVEFFSLEQCHFVLRTEQTKRGKELVIVCAEGKNLAAPLMFIIENAIKQQYNCLRYHPETKKRGLALARFAGLAVYWFDCEQYFIAFLRG